MKIQPLEVLRMHIQRLRYITFAFLGGLTALVATGCSETSISQLKSDVQRYPKTLVVGEWNGRFEVSDASGIRQLERSERYRDRTLHRKINDVKHARHYYRFERDGRCSFYDPAIERYRRGTWEIAEIEGRTVMIDIRADGGRYRKPMVFIGYNTIAFRPGVNKSPTAPYGKVVYYRNRTWAAKEQDGGSKS